MSPENSPSRNIGEHEAVAEAAAEAVAEAAAEAFAEAAEGAAEAFAEAAEEAVEALAAEIAEVYQSPRGRAWQSLLERKGWLNNSKIVLPANTQVYLFFPPATTDINTIEAINLQRVTEVTEHFVIHRVNAHEEEYYLWEDIQCLRIKTKKVRG